MIEEHKLDSFAVLTGDVHSSWAFDLPRRPLRQLRSRHRSRFAGSRVRRHVGDLEQQPRRRARRREAARATSSAARPHLHYVDGRYRGYFVVDLTRERLQADYFAMKTILDRTPEERFAKGFAAPAGQMHLTEQASPAPPQSAPDPAPGLRRGSALQALGLS